jgi:hypothetical protein
MDRMVELALRRIVRRQRIVNIALASCLAVMILAAATAAQRGAERRDVVVEVQELRVVNAEGEVVLVVSGTGLEQPQGGTVAHFGPDGIWARSFRVGRSAGQGDSEQGMGYFGVDDARPSLKMFKAAGKAVVRLGVGDVGAGFLELCDEQGCGLVAADGVAPR